MRDYRNLRVWQKAHQLVLSVYAATKRFPKEEAHGLTGQMRRAAIVIPATIVAAAIRTSDLEFARQLQGAIESTGELEYCLLLGKELGYYDPAIAQTLMAELSEVRELLAAVVQRYRPERPVPKGSGSF